MSVQLDPVTLDQLRALARRRRAVLLLRGVLAAVLSLLTAMALIAFADRLLVLGQPARVALSLAGYAAVLAVVYGISLRHLLKIPTHPQLARLIEDAEPGLREQVVSAVELSGDDPNAHDSELFRAVLQRNVGRRIQQVEMRRVLPWRVIAWWAATCGTVVALTVVLMLVPGLRYGELLTRAMLPTANMPRVSAVQITLVSPSGSETLVPMHEPVAVVVRVDGRSPNQPPDHLSDRVELEVHAPEAAAPQRLAMTPDGTPGRYRLDLQVQDRPVRFRVVAGDGRSRYHTLDPRPRPRVVGFGQVIEHPAYTGREPTRRQTERGDITALAGSVVRLTLTADQPIMEARLQLEEAESQAGEPRSVALTPDPGDPTRLTATVRLEHSGTYRVDLTARQTGLSNPDSPRYELTALGDALPEVTLETPAGMTSLPADALLRVLGRARDDVGLRRVEREARISGGPWLARPVPVGADGRVAEPIDLADLGLSEGDLVELRLAATDLAGHTARSAAAQLLVIPDGLHAVDVNHAHDTAALRTALLRLRQAAQHQAERYGQAREALGGDTIQARRAVVQALAARDAAREASTQAKQALDAALASAPAGRAGGEVARAGRLLARVAAQQALLPTQAVEAAGYTRAQALALRHAEYADEAAAGLAPLLAAEWAQVALLQLAALDEDLAGMIHDAEQDHAMGEGFAWQRLQRRLAANARQAQAAAQLFEAANQDADPAQRAYAQHHAQALRGQADLLREQARAAGPDEALRGLVAPYRDAVAAATRYARHLTHDLIAQETQQIGGRKPTDEGERLDAEQLFWLRDALAQAEAGPQRADQWAVALEVLRERARIEEQRQTPDLPFVTETSRLVSALSRLAREDTEAGSAPATLDRLASAYDVLERSHMLEQLRLDVATLAVSEHAATPETRPARLNTAHRRAWASVDRRLGSVSEWLGAHPSLQAAGERVDEVRQSREAGEARHEMDRRAHAAHSPQLQAEALAAMARMLAEAQALLADPLRLAREDLAEISGPLSARLRELADDQDRLRARTQHAADQAGGLSAGASPESVSEIAQGQADFRGRLGERLDEMRRQADQEDLMTPQGRDRARDVDDAIAMLRPDLAQTRRHLDDAQQAQDPGPRREALGDAARSQAQTAQTLRELADHFENTERGDTAASAQSREGLRRRERELGADQPLDEQFDPMQRLADLAAADDPDRLAALEEQLRQDPPMRRELRRIADQALDRAQSRLAEARGAEQAVAEQLEAQAADQHSDTNGTEERLARLAARAQRLERDQVRPLDRQAQRGAPEARDAVRRAQASLRGAAEQGRPDDQPLGEQTRREEQARRTQALATQSREAAEALEAAEAQARAVEEDAARRREEARTQAEQANAIGRPDEHAARQALEAAQQRDRARQAREQAERAAALARELAADAQSLADQAQGGEEQAQQQRAQAAERQQSIAEQVTQAAEQSERAARHAERLGDESRCQCLAEAAAQARGLAEQGLPEAADQIAEAADHPQAAARSREAEQQIAQGQEQLAQARRDASGSQDETREPGQGQPSSSPEVARALAEELDRLDRQRHAAADASPASSVPPTGGRAIDRAAQQQQQQIRARRHQQAQSLQPPGSEPPGNETPGNQTPGSPTPGNEAPGSEAPGSQTSGGPLPGGLVSGGGGGEWGDLPERIADDLNHGARERAPADYLDQVDAYFRAIARRAREAAQGSDGPE